MNKIWIILKSEFWRRVRSKWFIITTLLAPVLLVGITVLPGVLGATAFGSEEQTVAVVDESGALLERLQQEAGEGNYQFEAAEGPADSVRAAVRAGRYDGYLVLPASLLQGEGRVTYYSGEGGGLSAAGRLSSLVSRAVERERLAAENAPPGVLSVLESDVDVQMRTLTEEGEEADGGLLFAAAGYFMGFTIYMAVFIYGSFVMNAVIEEKTSRVVEIVVSSVRPFELLMGKVLGIGAMGLVQMILWGGLVFAGLTFAGSIAALFLDPADLGVGAGASQQATLDAAGISIPAVPLSLFVWFVLFFLGGYLLYASLFAAVGSAVEQQQDAQSLLFPITLPLIVPIMFIFVLVESPNSTLSVIMSMIPFFSPILMVVRAAVVDVPFWQVALSFLLLVGSFLGTIWLSSRIYRVGILMYGKKPSLRELARWVRYR